MGYARVNSFFWSYYNIATSQKEEFDKTYSIENEPEIEDDPDLYFELRTKRFNFGVQVIIFSALTLESLINDYASIKLGQSFFTKHVDKLNTVSKLLVTVQMQSDAIYPKEGQAYETIDFLFKIRNKLVHPKSKQMPFKKNGEVDAEKLLKMEEKYLNEWKETVRKCFSAILLNAIVLNELFPNETLFTAFKQITENNNNF